MSLDSLYWETAWRWVCRQRERAPASADIWDLRWRWKSEGAALFECVKSGHYVLSPMNIMCGETDSRAMWNARDALVLKWVALHITAYLPSPEGCMHLRGKGAHQSLREVSSRLRDGDFHFVHRTDIRGYYENINKSALLNHIYLFVDWPVLRELLHQYVHYSVEYGGVFHTPTKGIPRGCALSPLLGASMLRHIDQHFYYDEDVFYTRYMDDFLLLTKTRWHLKKRIKKLSEFFELSGFERHPEKTQTGRIEKGFDWLGIEFLPSGMRISPRSCANHAEQVAKITRKFKPTSAFPTLDSRLTAYEKRWNIWANSLLKACE